MTAFVQPPRPKKSTFLEYPRWYQSISGPVKVSGVFAYREGTTNDPYELQHDAMIQLGATPSGQDFVSPAVLEELLAMDLVYWRTLEGLDFTPMGERFFHELIEE